MFGYIYETTNLINGKKYIGQHRAEKLDNNYLGSGDLIIRAIEKYGKENFSVRILEECSSLEELNTKEKYWIRHFNADLSKDYYNIAAGGSNERAFRGKNNPMYNKHHTEESKIKMSKNQKSWNKGTHGLYSNEYREKISKALKGRKFSEEHKQKLRESWKTRKPITEEQRRIISERVKKAMANPEVRRKISETSRGRPNKMKGTHLTEEQRRIISEKTKEAMKNLPEESKQRMKESYKSRKPMTEEQRKRIGEAISKRTKGENNPTYSYYKLLHNNLTLYFSGRESLLQYCNKSFKLGPTNVRLLIKSGKPYKITKYDVTHNRTNIDGIIINKISKEEYYNKKEGGEKCIE